MLLFASLIGSPTGSWLYKTQPHAIPVAPHVPVHTPLCQVADVVQVDIDPVGGVLDQVPGSNTWKALHVDCAVHFAAHCVTLRPVPPMPLAAGGLWPYPPFQPVA